MRITAPLALTFVAACSGGGGGDGGTIPTDYTFECEVGEPYDLPDIYASTDGREHECEGQPQYIPELGTATAFFLGEFHWDDCGNLQGRETWILWSDQRLVELGLDDCQVVWKVTGEKGAPVTQGDYSLSFVANVDPSATTCPEDMLFYESTFNITYDVYDAGGATTFHFAQSGTLLGQGTGNANHATYVSGLNCELLGYATL